jgi:hypothetical protein
VEVERDDRSFLAGCLASHPFVTETLEDSLTSRCFRSPVECSGSLNDDGNLQGEGQPGLSNLYSPSGGDPTGRSRVAIRWPRAIGHCVLSVMRGALLFFAFASLAVYSAEQGQEQQQQDEEGAADGGGRRVWVAGGTPELAARGKCWIDGA